MDVNVHTIHLLLERKSSILEKRKIFATDQL